MNLSQSGKLSISYSKHIAYKWDFFSKFIKKQEEKKQMDGVFFEPEKLNLAGKGSEKADFTQFYLCL